MRFLIRTLINALALFVATRLVDGITYEGDWVGLLIVALIFGVLNAIVRPILALLTCPLIVLTLGLFTFVLNAIMLLLTGAASSALGLGFRVEGFLPALFGALIVTVVSIILSIFIPDDDRNRR